MAKSSDKTAPSVPVKRQAYVNRLHQIELQSRLSQLTPERLAYILSQAERGVISDWVDLCYRILSTDAHARADFETRTSAVAGSRFVIEPGTKGALPDSDDQLAAEMVDQALRRIGDLPQVFTELLDAIGVSISTQEIIWGYDRKSGRWLPEDLAWVYQGRFKFGDDWNLRLVDSTGQRGGDGDPLIPNKWIVHQPRNVAGYPSLTGCMRPVAWAYLFKRWSMQAWVLMAEKMGSPLIVGKLPRNADEAVRSAMKAGLENLSSDHAAILEDSSAIEIIDSGIRDGAAHKDLVDSMNREISKAILGLSGTTEQGGVGSYAAIESRQGATIDARKLLDASALASTLQRDLFKPILQFNRHLFKGTPSCPTIRWILGNENATLAGTTPDVLSLAKVTVNEIRASLDLEPMPREVGDLVVGESAKVDEPASGLATAPDVALPTDGSGEAAAVADTALNGAQIASLLEVVSLFNQGALTATQARVTIGQAFPTINQAAIAQLIPDQAPPTPAPALAPSPGAPIASEEPVQ